MPRRTPTFSVLLLVACQGSPGRLTEAGRPLEPCPPTLNCVSTEASDEEHGMAPVPFAEGSERAQAVARGALLAEPRMRIVQDVPGYLRAEATSAVFRLVDDVEVVVDTAARMYRFRSASRVGKGDMGANRARMERVSLRLSVGVGVPVPR